MASREADVMTEQLKAQIARFKAWKKDDKIAIAGLELTNEGLVARITELKGLAENHTRES